MDEALERLLALYKNPKHYGRLEGFRGDWRSSCGDAITVYVKVEKRRVVKAAFEGKGCVVAITSASLLMEMLMKEGQLPPLKAYLKALPVDVERNPRRLPCAMVAYKAAEKALSALSAEEGVEEP